ncbi:hypothetical protein ABIA33_007432 [Streptacidiphilus sp. MAP12-16]|uniref:hypothetical protein n=1 Tax=Streptacidiphilus sp. MAP12-16 TaxID=3156300 RepID=UPI0035196A33
MVAQRVGGTRLIAVGLSVGALVAAPLGISPQAVAASGSLTLDAACWRGGSDWVPWSPASPLAVQGGSDSGSAVDDVPMCELDTQDSMLSGPSTVVLSLDAASVAKSGYSPAGLAQRLHLMVWVNTANPQYVYLPWTVQPDGSIAAKIAGTDLSYNGTDVRYNINGAPASKTVQLTGSLQVLDQSGTVHGTTAIGINYQGKGQNYTPPTASGYRPLPPTRAMDTRTGLGAPDKPLSADSSTTLQLAGKYGIPASGVTAVVLNVTATNTSQNGYLTVYTHGQPRPGISSLNLMPGGSVAQQVVVPVVDGKAVFYTSAGPVDLVADVQGYFTGGAGDRFTGTTAARLMDTRYGTGVARGQVQSGHTVVLEVTGRGGIPASGVSSVVLNLTAVNAQQQGYVTAFADGQGRPSASSLNSTPGVAIANRVTVPVVDGKVDFYSSGSSDLIADVEGYYSSSGAWYFPITPTRIVDTRSGLGQVTRGKLGNLLIQPETWKNGIPPEGAKAFDFNVTVTDETGAGYLAVAPETNGKVTTSTLNYLPGRNLANQVVVSSAPYDIVQANAVGGKTDFIADLDGYYADF